jgi:hypothetical protein
MCIVIPQPRIPLVNAMLTNFHCGYGVVCGNSGPS